MLDRFICWLERRRSRRSLLRMVGGLLRVADDWEDSTLHDGVFNSRRTLTSAALGVSLRWRCSDSRRGRDEHTFVLVTAADGDIPLPPELNRPLAEAVQRVSARLKRHAATDAAIRSEQAVAEWVVKNARQIRRTELVSTVPEIDLSN